MRTAKKLVCKKMYSTSGSGKKSKESERNVDFYCIDSVKRTLLNIWLKVIWLVLWLTKYRNITIYAHPVPSCLFIARYYHQK